MEDVAWFCGSDAGAADGAISLKAVRAVGTLWAVLLCGAEAGASAATEFPRDAAAGLLVGGVVVVRCGG